MVHITVELLGSARRLAGTKLIEMSLDEQATHRDVLRRLTELYPPLGGAIIDTQTFELMPAFMLNLNGRKVISDLNTPLESGECLVLMFIESGG
jgi:hypothetical protein